MTEFLFIFCLSQFSSCNSHSIPEQQSQSGVKLKCILSGMKEGWEIFSIIIKDFSQINNESSFPKKFVKHACSLYFERMLKRKH